MPVTVTPLGGNVYKLRKGHGIRKGYIKVKFLFGEASTAEKFRGGGGGEEVLVSYCEIPLIVIDSTNQWPWTALIA